MVLIVKSSVNFKVTCKKMICHRLGNPIQYHSTDNPYMGWVRVGIHNNNLHMTGGEVRENDFSVMVCPVWVYSEGVFTLFLHLCLVQ